MDYIILNGISSETVPGLEIETLPTIMKPAMRTQVEEIDGRSGNFVFPVGYAAYTRSFQIGIKAPYDLDEIISFFNSEGTAIFSNEPDKYYRYMITEPIVFEPITTIEMRVQPFKYSTIDGKKVFSFDNQFINLKDCEKVENGLTLTCTNNEIKVTGQSLVDAEIMVPMEQAIELEPGAYELVAYIGGNAVGCSVRVVQERGEFRVLNDLCMHLHQEATVIQAVRITKEENYSYLYLTFVKGNIYDFKLKVCLHRLKDKQINILNRGNVNSRPIITVYGIGNVDINLNNNSTLSIYFPEYDYITINTETMEAYKKAILKNRAVKGNYNEFFFVPGNNTMCVSGNIQKIIVEDFSRWI